MKILGIDKEKCTNCLKCIKICPSQLFSKQSQDKKNNVLFEDPNRLCIRCGHCIAICPVEAITYEDADAFFDIGEEKNLAKIVSFDDLLKILRMRRSMRVYKKEDVSKEKIEAVLEAMRYAPAASNLQGWRYIVLTNKNEINYLSNETSKLFKIARKLLPLRYLVAPFLTGGARRRVLSPKSKIQLDNALKRMKKGEDVVFFDAPCVVILYSKKYANAMSANDAGIAFTHGMLAAQALGLGTCWVGFAQRRLQNIRRIKKHFQIPKGYHVWGVMTIGHPAMEYQRAPPRRELRVKWIE